MSYDGCDRAESGSAIDDGSGNRTVGVAEDRRQSIVHRDDWVMTEFRMGTGEGTSREVDGRWDDSACGHWRAWQWIWNPGCCQEELCADDAAYDDAEHDDALRCEWLVEVLFQNHLQRGITGANGG